MTLRTEADGDPPAKSCYNRAMERPGRFIMIDGIAGSGKSTLLRAAQEWARLCEHRVFDLGAWSKEHAEPPRFEEIADYDAYFTFEPTRQWVGSAIRFEMSRTDAPYSGTSLAHAFALDREIMYKRLILPALDAGKTVIQDRGVSTSIAYQPIMPNGLALEDLVALPGNALALKHAPGHLILTRLDPAVAIERVKMRDEESKGVFADLDFLRRVDERFRSDWFQEMFRTQNTIFHELPTDAPLDATVERAQRLISTILTSC